MLSARILMLNCLIFVEKFSCRIVTTYSMKYSVHLLAMLSYLPWDACRLLRRGCYDALLGALLVDVQESDC